MIASALEARLSPPPLEADDDPVEIEREAKALRDERERVVTAFERGLRNLTDTERRTREIDATLERLNGLRSAKQTSHVSRKVDPIEIASQMASAFAEWAFLTRKQKRKILAAGVERVTLARPSRRDLYVESVALQIPESIALNAPPSSTPSAWGYVLLIPVGRS